jgi:hypothetical protein
MLKGNGTAISAASSGTDYGPATSALATGILKNTTGTGAHSIAIAADFPTLNQSTTGSAATLTTGRTVQTNLASTSSATFNGSANITPGVTGTLPVLNGGTGVTTSTGTGSNVLSVSPALTGSPTTPTQTANDNSTKIASTAYVDAKAGTQSLVSNEVPAGTINGSNVTFTLASTPATNSLALHKNGIRLKPGGADYTLSGNTVTFVTAPPTGAVLLADYTISNTAFSVGTNSLISDETPTGLVNSSNTSYTAARAYIAGALEVYINGVKQVRGTHFTETTPASGIFTMSDAPLTGDVISINYQFNLNPASNADAVDGIHASATATANQLLALDGNGKFPLSTLLAGMTAVQTQSNAGTAGGTMYWMNLAGIKILWGVSGANSMTNSTNATYTWTLPTSFFTTLQTVLPTLDIPGAATNSAVSVGLSARSTTTITTQLTNQTGGTNSISHSLLVIGT